MYCTESTQSPERVTNPVTTIPAGQRCLWCLGSVYAEQPCAHQLGRRNISHA